MKIYELLYILYRYDGQLNQTYDFVNFSFKSLLIFYLKTSTKPLELSTDPLSYRVFRLRLICFSTPPSLEASFSLPNQQVTCVYRFLKHNNKNNSSNGNENFYKLCKWMLTKLSERANNFRVTGKFLASQSTRGISCLIVRQKFPFLFSLAPCPLSLFVAFGLLRIKQRKTF